jgi:tRNA threonylcarbamoyladenosine modification (KEOPS) complex  Pcc1 subunit
VPIAEIIYEAVQHGVASSKTSKVKLRLKWTNCGLSARNLPVDK